ncbi:hypothetical protein CVT24_005615 [Panaeolus cyanescens]|uniref:Uncharacterized protein n=1 Tax=Panaeolus cyanescens TaxID=181874 RepID=A0A409YY34_9AGAR|nr:hypothetical protein CVT24_005615 [Panaeolus cyanescens]
MTSTVEDNDSRIIYSGRWKHPAVHSASGGTVAQTDDSGASLSLSFTGSQVMVFCSVNSNDNNGVHGAIFSIDNSDPQSLSKSGSAPAIQRPCWTSRILSSPAQHILTISIRGRATEFTLDRIDIVSNPPIPIPSSPAPLPPPPPPPPQPTPGPPDTTPSTSPSNNISFGPNLSTFTLSALTNQPTFSPPNAVAGLPTSVTDSPVNRPNTQTALLPSQSIGNVDSFTSTDYAGVFSSLLGTQTGPNLGPTPTPSNRAVVFSSTSSEASIAKVVGAVLGSLLVVLVLAIIAYVAVRRRKKKKQLLDSEIESPYSGYDAADYQNLHSPGPNTRAHNAAEMVTPYTVAPSQTQYYTTSQWQPTTQHTQNQQSRPSSFSSSMYTDGPPLRAT